MNERQLLTLRSVHTGAIQALEAKERLNIEMYGLYDPEKGAWIEINEPLTNYGFVNGVRKFN